jgi:hypothetical protein
MLQADMATGPYHEARENDGLLYRSASAVGNDEEAAAAAAAAKRWYHDEKVDIKYSLASRYTESSKAQRRVYPGYSKLETRSFDQLDWRDVNIVSPIPQ